MKEVLFLTLKDSVPGFKLAGIRQIAADPDSAWEKIVQASQDSDIGVIAVDNRVLGQVDPVKLRELTERWPGVFVNLPEPLAQRQPPEDELQRLVQRALGYHIRLNK